jgi:hypothetical protein
VHDLHSYDQRSKSDLLQNGGYHQLLGAISLLVDQSQMLNS